MGINEVKNYINGNKLKISFKEEEKKMKKNWAVKDE